MSDFSLKKNELPVHVGIIMDGNGRWARQKNRPRSKGHEEGLKAAKQIVAEASRLGIKYVSLYAFSTENWKRAEDEVTFLMHLIKAYVRKEMPFYRKHNIRFHQSGDLESMQPEISEELKLAMEETKDHTGLFLNMAINYGGRDEIKRAVNKIIGSNQTGNIRISSDDIAKHLDCPHFPDADLIIRTGGEQRLSNFLLWRSAYSEFYFSEKYWPDWDASDLQAAVNDYASRNRRFGGVKNE